MTWQPKTDEWIAVRCKAIEVYHGDEDDPAVPMDRVSAVDCEDSSSNPVAACNPNEFAPWLSTEEQETRDQCVETMRRLASEIEQRGDCCDTYHDVIARHGPHYRPHGPHWQFCTVTQMRERVAAVDALHSQQGDAG